MKVESSPYLCSNHTTEGIGLTSLVLAYMNRLVRIGRSYLIGHYRLLWERCIG